MPLGRASVWCVTFKLSQFFLHVLNFYSTILKLRNIKVMCGMHLLQFTGSHGEKKTMWELIKSDLWANRAGIS